MPANWDANASLEWNVTKLGTSIDREVGNVVLTTGIQYSTQPGDEIILVSGAIAPIFINLVASGLSAGKMFTIKDVGTATAGVGGIVISGLSASIDGIASGFSMTSGYKVGVTSAAGKTYNKVSMVYDGVGFWIV